MRSETRPFGGIAGFTLKIARESIKVSQERFAEAIGADSTTVQSWESGRRPLASVSTAQLQRIGRQLLLQQADAGLVAMLPVAVEADLVITSIASPHVFDEADRHPLAGCVMDLRLTELLAWALSGAPPRFAKRLPPARRRGPVPTRPEINRADRQQLETNLLELSQYLPTKSAPLVLMRRQACFLAGLARLDAKPVLSPLASRYLASGERWNPSWADARSYAASRAYRGDPQPLRDFIAQAHANDDCDTAALNYTAYWVGDLPDREGNDAFMVRSDRRWRGMRMYPHLVERFQEEHPLIDLNVHNLWLLLRAQSSLTDDDPDTTRLLNSSIEPLGDSDRISEQSRRELRSIRQVLADQ